ncbi:MAG TPA: hypothetical protein VKU03_13300 [Roseiarcus sp.]|nr:hypothetical protein [Roseiarcus sp.]
MIKDRRGDCAHHNVLGGNSDAGSPRLSEHLVFRKLGAALGHPTNFFWVGKSHQDSSGRRVLQRHRRADPGAGLKDSLGLDPLDDDRRAVLDDGQRRRFVRLRDEFAQNWEGPVAEASLGESCAGDFHEPHRQAEATIFDLLDPARFHERDEALINRRASPAEIGGGLGEPHWTIPRSKIIDEGKSLERRA